MTEQVQDLVERLRQMAEQEFHDAADALEAQAEQIRFYSICMNTGGADELRAELTKLRTENEKLTNALKVCNRIIHNATVANQSAWIEWKHGGGAESAMEWIENGLDGPGLIPEGDEPHATNAQAYFDANKSSGDAHD